MSEDERRQELVQVQHQWYADQFQVLFGQRQVRHTKVEQWYFEQNVQLDATLQLRLRYASQDNAELFSSLGIGEVFTIPPDSPVMVTIPVQMPDGYAGAPTAVLCYECGARANQWANAFGSERQTQLHVCPRVLVLKKPLSVDGLSQTDT